MSAQDTTSTSDTRTDGLRDRAADALGSARERAIEAYDSARQKASESGRKAGDSIAQAPLIALGGGLAIGALLASLLPRTNVEKKLIGPVGQRLTGAGRSAIDAARTAGQEKLSELNITADAGKSAVQSLIDGIGQAAKSSGQAAIGAVRDRR
ncbi:DUF883 family protein [Sphingomonas rhizophila]|uniref:DUF883 family protein n=1 Tax=Sphingomonas rhizophila TaxID=2071607 RepID=A0A7G9SDB4_9SPHN|nr:DUF883 family protein [Sphingomonas rhizophila]QNN65839.1 DUF883 family protein [Sphingomonas rhizophila]